MIIADRIKKGIEKHGAENILIHTIPKTPLWLICQKIKNKNPPPPDSWEIFIGNPLQTKLRLVSQNVTNEEHLLLWKKLVELEVSSKLTTAQQTLKKCAEQFKIKNKIKLTKIYEQHILNNRISSKGSSTRRSSNKRSPQKAGKTRKT